MDMEVGDGEPMEKPMETETKDNETEKVISLVRKPNPFLIDHIVDKIVNNNCFTKSDRLKLRGLSKEWNRSATKHLKLELNLTEEENANIRMRDAISLLENPNGNFNFLTRVRFTDEFFPASGSDFTLEFHRTFGSFLSLISTQVESLHVSLEPLDSEMDFYESCYADELKFPKLKSLEFLGNGNPLFFFLGKALLMGSSILNYLYLDYDSYCCEDLALTYRNAYANMILKNLPASIQKLFLITTFTSYDAQILSSVHLPNLTSLEMYVVCSDEVTGTDLYNVFNNSINMTLIKLDFQLSCTAATAEVEFVDFNLPVFPFVTDLDLHFRRPLFPVNPDLLSFPQLFPKVRRFRYEDEYMTRFKNCHCLFSALFPLGFAADEVRSCRWEHPCTKEEQMQKVLQGFGLLQKLTIRVPETNYLANFKLIFQFCPLLEELYLEFDDEDEDEDEDNPNLDSILTGIPEDVLELLRQIPDWRESAMDIGIAHFKEHPGLSDLKNLKILGCKYFTRYQTQKPEYPVNITLITVFFGIQQLPKFEKLITPIDTPLSAEVIAELKLRFGENVIEQHKGTSTSKDS